MRFRSCGNKAPPGGEPASMEAGHTHMLCKHCIVLFSIFHLMKFIFIYQIIIKNDWNQRAGGSIQDSGENQHSPPPLLLAIRAVLR